MSRQSFRYEPIGQENVPFFPPAPTSSRSSTARSQERQPHSRTQSSTKNRSSPKPRRLSATKKRNSRTGPTTHRASYDRQTPRLSASSSTHSHLSLSDIKSVAIVEESEYNISYGAFDSDATRNRKFRNKWANTWFDSNSGQWGYKNKADKEYGKLWCIRSYKDLWPHAEERILKQYGSEWTVDRNLEFLWRNGWYFKYNGLGKHLDTKHMTFFAKSHHANAAHEAPVLYWCAKTPTSRKKVSTRISASNLIEVGEWDTTIIAENYLHNHLRTGKLEIPNQSFKPRKAHTEEEGRLIRLAESFSNELEKNSEWTLWKPYYKTKDAIRKQKEEKAEREQRERTTPVQEAPRRRGNAAGYLLKGALSVGGAMLMSFGSNH